LGCEQAILDANVESHQLSCEEFGKIYELDLENILKYLSTKILALKDKVKHKSDTLR
jgi:hypothetical protein